MTVFSAFLVSLIACSSAPTDPLSSPANEENEENLSIYPASIYLSGEGDSVQLDARVQGREEDLAHLQWKSLDDRVATVSSKGKVIAKGRGSTRVTASSGSLADTSTVTVQEAFVELPAFPEAEGYGALALSRCDRSHPQVVFVTNLDSDGPGSLRDALRQSDPTRLTVVVFRTGGTITLESKLEPEHGCLYVAGQTAPGDGILLRSPDDENHGVGLFTLPRDQSVTDLVLRYVRFRNGRGAVNEAGNFNIKSGRHIIFDHVSTAWANSNNGMVYSVRASAGGFPPENVTIQWSMITTGLTPHSVGLNIGAHPIEGPFPVDVSIHHNAFIHNSHRNPLIRRVNSVQVINNVVYNWKGRVGNVEGGPTVDYIGNYWKRGPWSESTVLQAIIDNRDSYRLVEDPNLYMSSNVGDPWQMDPTADQTSFIQYGRDREGPLPATAFVTAPQANPRVPVSIDAAAAAYERVLADAGASARLSCRGDWIEIRDPVDRLLIEQTRNGNGPATDDETDHHDDYGGFPFLSAGSPCADTDSDGMPDEWEARYGLDTSDPSDLAGDPDGDGYRNIEEYVNGTPPESP